jgi:hypothetical protein
MKMKASEFDKHPELGDDYWGEHPEFAVTSWMQEVNYDDTRLGYWDWVLAMIEGAECE